MAYSRWGLTNPLYRGRHISFVRLVNDLLIKYSISLALVAAVRTFADGVNAGFTVIPRLLICSHFVICSPFASPESTRRSSGWPPIVKRWLLLAFIGRSHLWHQLSACSIEDLTSCCWLLGVMSFTSWAKNKLLQISSFSTSFIHVRNRSGPRTKPWGTPIRYLQSRGGLPISLEMSCS